MDFILAGPGRAGLALTIRLTDSGHELRGVLARDRDAGSDVADRFGSDLLAWDEPLPEADLLVLAVRDDAISAVATRLAPIATAVDGVVHLSGLTSIATLEVFEDLWTGSFHPLQTLPTPEVGAARLTGAWVAITTDDDFFADRLFSLAASAGMRGFELGDSQKAVYHAAAAAAANFPLAALDMSHRLFGAAGVPFEAAGPLIRAVVENALTLGPAEALTGPIARGDVGTVRAQLTAVSAAAPELFDDFVGFAKATARTAGTTEEMKAVLR